MHKYALVLAFSLLSTTAFARPFPTASELAHRAEIAQALQQDQTAFDFSGQARLPGCSGSVVSFGQADSAQAVVLTNGHCIGMMDGDPNAVIVNEDFPMSVSLYVDKTKTIPAKVRKIVYGLIQPHDIAFLELDKTYAELTAKGVKARPVSPKVADVGTDIALASGYFGSVSTCKVEGLIFEIREDVWTNSNSYKYHCKAEHGTSGSPLVNLNTGEVIGVNYTGNDDGEQCTYNNPCEVDAQGNITVDQGAGYGDQVYKIMTCLNVNRELDLTAQGCLLPKPATLP